MNFFFSSFLLLYHSKGAFLACFYSISFVCLNGYERLNTNIRGIIPHILKFQMNHVVSCEWNVFMISNINLLCTQYTQCILLTCMMHVFIRNMKIQIMIKSSFVQRTQKKKSKNRVLIARLVVFFSAVHHFFRNCELWIH